MPRGETSLRKLAMGMKWDPSWRISVRIRALGYIVDTHHIMKACQRYRKL